MKKTFYLALAVMAMGFASCGNKTPEATEAGDSAIVDTMTSEADDVVAEMSQKLEANDAEAMATLSQKANQKIADLVAKGDTAAAKAYAFKIKQFIDANSEKVKTIANGNETISGLINTVSNTNPNDIAKSAVEAVKADANHVAGETKEAVDKKVEDTKEAAKAKANETVENAKAKANAKVDEVKGKANEKVNDAVNKGLGKIGLK